MAVVDVYVCQYRTWKGQIAGEVRAATRAKNCVNTARSRVGRDEEEEEEREYIRGLR